MATKKEKEQLIEILKFTPRTYKIRLWGYGGEYAMGTVDRKIYDYFRYRRLDVSDFSWNSDYAEENNIPEDMCPFQPGSWYECDNIAHTNGVDRSGGNVQIEDENENIIFEKNLEECNGYDDDSPEWECGSESFIDEQVAGTVVFIGTSTEKGTFFEGDIDLKEPFNITKLTLLVEEVDGVEIVYGARYEDSDIDNWGGDTTGKGSEFGFYVAGSLKDGKWERYRNMDDCVFEMTDWFPKKINPIREGIYEIDTGKKSEWPNFSPTTARWTGTRWISAWNVESSDSAELKIKQWRGIAFDPDAN